MNSLFALLSLSVLAAPANDNAVIDAPVCVACSAHGASADALCDDCDADMMAHYSDGAYSDPEALCYEAGIDTDPRF
jgi:hypothetical protein